MCYAEDYFFQEVEADLPQGAAAVIPVDDIDHVAVDLVDIFAVDLIGDAVDPCQDDEVSGKAISELSFVMIFFVQVGVVDIEIGDACLQTAGEVSIEVFEVWPEEV